MILSVLVCLSSFIMLVILLRWTQLSFGLPIAYLFTLLFIHVPGAIAHIHGGDGLSNPSDTEFGIYLTAVASACFLLGVALLRVIDRKHHGLQTQPAPGKRRNFPLFCLVAGLGITYTLATVVNIPSLGAVIGLAGGIWVLGVILGLKSALRKWDLKRIGFWGGAMAIFPLLTLLLGGFLSFGSTPVFIILSSLVVFTRSNWRVGVIMPLAIVLFFNLFISYFIVRDDIRAAVWGGGSMGARIEESSKIITDYEMFDADNPSHLIALDRRLNQNMFVGMAANRLASGQVDYLNGRSFYEGFVALIPRIIWPNKPVFAGSGDIITVMTGFVVNDTTSWGIGNVMEFYINFGLTSVIIGFLLFGVFYGWLDKAAILALQQGDYGKCILYFMPAAATIHPNGSFVEFVGAGTAALIAAFGWRKLWNLWTRGGSFGKKRQTRGRPKPSVHMTGRSNQDGVALTFDNLQHQIGKSP